LAPPSLQLLAEEMIKNKSLRELNWWKVGGEAEYFAAPKTVEELTLVWTEAHAQKLPVTILSGGSNVLVKEGVIKGLVLSLHELKGIETAAAAPNGRFAITCLAGTPKAEIARIFMQQKLWPAVFLTVFNRHSR
jgi:UDP-N-acetylenolpyruvoylglucosamine reductase